MSYKSRGQRVRFAHHLLVALVTVVFQFCAPTQAFTEAESDIFGGPRLHAIEQQLNSIALANNAKPRKKTEEELQNEIHKILDSVENPGDLATLAIWTELNYPSNEVKAGLVDYGQIMIDIQETCIGRISQLGRPAAEEALKEVIYQSNIDGHKSETLRDAMSGLHKKEWEFPVRVYVSFEDKRLDKTPLQLDRATYRYEVCRALWKGWQEKSNPKDLAERGSIDATVVVLANGRVAKLTTEVTPDSSTHSRIDEKYEKVVQLLVRNVFEGRPLPDGIKRLKLNISFNGP